MGYIEGQIDRAQNLPDYYARRNTLDWYNDNVQTLSHRLNTPLRYSTISDPPSLLSP